MAEGIWYSMKSGEAGGLSAVETLEKDDVSAKTLKAIYDQNLDQTVKDDLRLALKIRRRFLNTDAQQQRAVVSVAKDTWWADLVERTIDGTSSYKKVIRQTWSRPDKVFKTLYFIGRNLRTPTRSYVHTAVGCSES
jgi:flavin-dependent dehydrogenase